MVRQARKEGLHDRTKRNRRQRRRSRRQYRRELFVQIGAQLYAILQCRGGQAAGSAIERTGQGETQETRLGYRASSCGRRGATDHSLRRGRQLLAALREEFRAARKQPI